jgi:hypothetical protein
MKWCMRVLLLLALSLSNVGAGGNAKSEGGSPREDGCGSGLSACDAQVLNPKP